jgi:ribonuclease HII
MLVAGLDEVGMGSISGPLCVCIAVFDDRKNMDCLEDSKKLTENQRKELSKKIEKEVLEYAFGWANVEEIEELNVFHARDLAAKRAFEKLKNVPDKVYTDGNHLIDLGVDVNQEAIVKGDNKIWQISAASILAKLKRDAHMIKLCAENGHKYDWENNKGYYSPKHNQGMLEYGISPEHRKHFFYVGKILYKTGQMSKNEYEKKYSRNLKKRREKKSKEKKIED